MYAARTYFLLFVNETSDVSFREQPHQTAGDSSESRRSIIEEKWLPLVPYINKEYENFNSDDELTSPLSESGDASHQLPSYPESISKSFWTSLKITIALLPLTAFMMASLYLDLKTTDLCTEWQYHNHS